MGGRGASSAGSSSQARGGGSSSGGGGATLTRNQRLIQNAGIMFGTNSPQYREAIRRFG